MDKVWKGRWIMDEAFYGLSPINVFHRAADKTVSAGHREDLKNHHMLVRKKFNIAGRVDEAFIDITADDYYKLYVNGRFVGQGPAPSYYFHYSYNRYDLSEFLNPGENLIAVHVYYQGLVNRVWNSGDYRQGMIAEIFVSGTLHAATDSTWKYMRLKAYRGDETTGYDTQYLENIDNRLMMPGWKELKFDDSAWLNARVHLADDHKLIRQETPPVEVYNISPALVKCTGEGRYFIDFGQEITGQFTMKASGRAGQVIEIRCGEELEDEDSHRVRFDMRCNCRYREFWTLSGRCPDVLEHYDYKAFRYVEVIAPRGVSIDAGDFGALVRHYPLDESKCRFYSSDSMLNRVWNLCKNGVKYGCQEQYVDCPSREKGQYGGDVTVTAHAHIYLSGDLRLFKKALRDFALSGFISSGLMAVAPGSLMQEIADYSLQWPMQLLLYYRQSGDIEFLREMFPTALGILNFFRRYTREDGLLANISDMMNLVDWPANLRDGYDFKLDSPVQEGCHNVINAFYYGALVAVNSIRSVLNMEVNDEVQRLGESFVKAFFDLNSGLFVDAQGSNHSALHSNVLPLFFGLVPEDAKTGVISFIKEKGMSCGVYMSYFLMKALAAAGEYDAVYRLITSKDVHSWGNMLKEGATTCFEAWGKDQKWNTSLCHPWASAPIPVVVEDLLGLKPHTAGWREISFTPHISDDIREINLEIHTVRGKIALSFRDGKFDLKIPEECRIV